MNRIFSAALREAVDLVDQGIATAEDVDVGMRLGYGWNVGPFEIADNAGLDTCARVGQTMKALGAGHLAPSSNLIERMVSEGRLGRKAERGSTDTLPKENACPGRITTIGRCGHGSVQGRSIAFQTHILSEDIWVGIFRLTSLKST